MEMSIAENLDKISKMLPGGVKLVAVSKTKPTEAIEEAYRWGQRIFGENKVQELVEKHKVLPLDIEWHMIGHLQTNKVSEIAPFITMIHAVDSLKLLKFIDKESARNERVIDCLLQFHIAQEETKFGLNYEEAVALLESEEYKAMKHIRIAGVMGVATNTDDTVQLHKEFRYLHDIFDQLQRQYFGENGAFRELSMGMSGDYQIAIQEGSTMIRLGSSIFGERIYPPKKEN